MKHIFHVHTYRCKHASEELDEEYIKTALSFGAKKNNIYGSLSIS